VKTGNVIHVLNGNLDNAFSVFTFFDMTLQRNVTSRIFLNLKNVENLFSNEARYLFCSECRNTNVNYRNPT